MEEGMQEGFPEGVAYELTLQDQERSTEDRAADVFQPRQGGEKSMTCWSETGLRASEASPLPGNLLQMQASDSPPTTC